MKKLFIPILILLHSHLHGQIVTSEVKVETTNDITSINGKVGIGTSTPSEIFSTTSGGAGLHALFGQGITTGVSQIAIGEMDAVNKAAFLSYDHSNNKFGVAIGGDNAFSFSLADGGHLGLLQSSIPPNTHSTYKSAFFGSAALMSRSASGTDSYLTSNTFYNNSSAWEAIFTSGNGFGTLSVDGGKLSWFSYDGSVTTGSTYSMSERFRIDKSGNVGIGTTNPTEKLEVNGKIRADYLRVKASTSSEGGEIALDGPMGFNDWRIDNYTGDYRLHHSGTLYFRIKSNGDVGIGSQTPSYKLHVNGSIKGTTLHTDTQNWSDFVFADDYDLLPLSEVERYIIKNNHLPDIPSEAEVMKEGINVGEMDARLLRKIEELTLYTIQQSKEIQNLKSENQELIANGQKQIAKQIEELTLYILEQNKRIKKLEQKNTR